MPNLAPAGGLGVPALPVGCITRFALPETMTVVYATNTAFPAAIERDAKNYLAQLLQNMGRDDPDYVVTQADVNIVEAYISVLEDCRITAVVNDALAARLPAALATAMEPVMAEIEARRKNLRAERSDDPLFPVVLAAKVTAGVNIPDHFPATKDDLLALTGPNLVPFEAYYGLPGVGSIEARRQHLAEEIGLPFF
jgi:hypothetical protein